MRHPSSAKSAWKTQEVPDKRLSSIRACAEEMNVKWVGMEPGRPSLVTAAALDVPRWTEHMTLADIITQARPTTEDTLLNRSTKEWPSRLAE